MYIRQENGDINVVQILEVIEQGVTVPLCCKLDNNSLGIIKYPKNPAGTASLINEWIGSCLADILGLNIPEYGICYMSKEIVTKSDYYDEIGEKNSGKCFFSKKISKSVPVTDALLKISKNKEAERIILFDYLVDNKDRHNGNLIFSLDNEGRVFFIDCSHIIVEDNHSLNIPLNMVNQLSKEYIVDNYLLDDSENNIYNKLCLHMGYDENVLREEAMAFKKRISEGLIDNIISSIPSDWLTDFTIKRINDMKQIILRRVELIDDYCEVIIQSRRKHKWKKY